MPVARYKGGVEQKMSKAEKTYTVCTDTETKSDIWMYKWQFTWRRAVLRLLRQTPSTGIRHPSTTAIVDYAIGLEKLSANEQFFDDAQTAVSL